MRLSAGAVLAVIDLQNIFADPTSGWFVPRIGEIVQPIRQLRTAFADRTVFTRFLAPERPTGAWQAYYQRWPFALVPADAWYYRLIEDFDEPGLATLDSTTFGKWDQLAGLVGPGDELVLAGVSTDCCVLSTAVAAADAGVRVLIATQACAASDDAGQQRALELLGLYAPLVELVAVPDLLAAAHRP